MIFSVNVSSETLPELLFFDYRHVCNNAFISMQMFQKRTDPKAETMKLLILLLEKNVKGLPV